MSQEALDYGRDYRVTEAYRAVLRTLNDVVDAIGLLQCAGACGCRTPELSDALAGRSTRYVRIEWLLALMDISPIDYRVRLVSALINWVGLAPKPLSPPKPEEQLAHLKQKVAAKFGAAGLELIAEEDVFGSRR